MVPIKSGTKTIEVTPMEVTFGNVQTMREWKQKLATRSFTSKGTLQNIMRLVAQMPDLADLVSISGDYNQSTIKRRSKPYIDDGASPEEATARVKAEMEAELMKIAAENPDVARAIFFQDINLPNDRESIAIGIACIQATADRSELTKEHKALLDSKLESPFWSNVSVKAVQEYCDLFCQALE